MSANLNAVLFDAPLVNPSPQGLYSAVTWPDEGELPRWLDSGVQIIKHNYGQEAAMGVWDAPWCGEPGSGDTDLKTGVRPEDPAPFLPITAWAYDECDPRPSSRDEIRVRVAQNMRLGEQVMVERQFADRLVDDATSLGIVGAPDLRLALGYIEGLLAKTNTVGMVHASPEWASREFGLVVPSGTAVRTPLGHLWVFGGGYVDGLGDLIVATSPVYGWRDQVQVRETFQQETNTYAAIAERSVVIGYEQLIGAVLIADGSL